ncbi:MAG TPA: thiaminase II [Streptosporangiaceae bacterium]|jgi:thiaminase/transcriptional activator TenA|nr:thiaminase II [Streptosporangiaceae bacterium]
MTDTLTGQLWRDIAGTYDAILAHPFLAGLADGTLAQDAFAFYVVQDALYLHQYARALAALGARAPDAAATEMFARHAADALAVERALHAGLLPELGIGPAVIAAAEPAPANLAYTSFLLAAVGFGSYAEGVGAVLPCYWIYWEVGRELARRGSPDPRYQRWIDTYAGEDFAAVVREVLAAADALGPCLPPAERDRVRRNFRTASRYEWMFWDMGYRMAGWPV